MVKRRTLLILSFAVIVLVVVFLLTSGDKDIRQIQKNLNIAVSLVEKKHEETIITSLTRVQKLASFSPKIAK